MGHEVVVLDDLSTGRAENLEAVQQHPRFEIVVGSVTDEGVVRKLVMGVDVVYHLAAAVGVQLILDRPVETIETNIVGTETVLRVARETRPRVVLSPPRRRSTARTTACRSPRTTTGCSARRRRAAGATRARRRSTSSWRWRTTASTACRSPSSASSTRSVRARPAATAWSCPRFVRQALDGQPITVYGDGRQSRCFTDVEDTVRATIALSLAPAAVGEVFNVGTTRRGDDRSARRARAGARGQRLADRCSCRTTRPTSRASRTCAPRPGHREGGAGGGLPPARVARRDAPARDRPPARYRAREGPPHA